MEEECCKWVVHFLLRQPNAGKLLSRILSFAPLHLLDDNLQFKRLLLLHAIQEEIEDGSVSEKTLEILEIIEEIDRKEGFPTPDSIQVAYCAVAVECTVKFLCGSLVKYLDAVTRIWRVRIANLEKFGSNRLLGGEYKKWREDIEAALYDLKLRESLLSRSTRIDAFRSLKVFIGDVFLLSEPSFLEVAGSTVIIDETLEEHTELGNELCEKENQTVTERQHLHVGGSQKRLRKAQKDVENEKRGRESPTLIERESFEGEGQNVSSEGKDASTHWGSRRSSERNIRAIEVSHVQKLGVNQSSREENGNFSRKLNKMQQELMTSLAELRALVKDPLPEAIQKAKAVADELERKKLNSDLMVSSQNKMDTDVLSPSKTTDDELARRSLNNDEVAAGQNEMDTDIGAPSNMTTHELAREGLNDNPVVARQNHTQSEQDNRGTEAASHQDHGKRPSLMERNSTAHTYKWDDSMDGTSNHEKGIHLRTLTRTVSLKTQNITKFARRRKAKRWSVEEEEALIEGVRSHGKGKWKLILTSNPDVFRERTEVDLKDKWRNLTR